jgi:GNAT superfamily N-acetyltransferase
MWFRLKRSQFEAQEGEGNRLAMKEIVDSGEIPGLIAYFNSESNTNFDKPVGWISVAPREHFPVLDRSRILKRVDQKQVWSIVCFFVHKDHRKIGMTRSLLESALVYAKENGAEIVEAYPVDPKKKKSRDAFLYHGLYSSFVKSGFVEVARRSETRPIMRYYY